MLTLSDLFQLQFRIQENDNDTGWADKLSHVGSEGTDTLVKAIINIMLINVFKEKVSRKFGDFRIHCMMDEIGKLHLQNVKGILDLAGIHIFLTEYHAHLGDRASFMIPPDIDERLQHGSRERYVAQYAKFGHLSTDIPLLQQLIEQIHRCRRCYDQEGYVAGDACGE